MKSIASFVRRILGEERGDVLPVLAVSMVALLGMGGFTIDVGRAYVLREQLQNSTNAAALAASGEVYNNSSTENATAYADQYGSSASADSNYNSSLGTVTTAVTTKCLNSLMTSGTCANTGSIANAVQVTQTATLKTTFMSLFGVKTLTVSTEATASMQGVAHPWNVAIVVDTTGSMSTADSDCNNLTELQCALSGVQTLLAQTNPCPAGVTSCSSTANFRVSLFTFPNVLIQYNGGTINSISDDLNCNGSPATYSNYSKQPIAAPYTLPIPGETLPGAPNATYLTYTQTSTNKTWEATYQITPFLSDYYSASSSTKLSSSSELVEAVGYGSTSGCLTYTFGIDGNAGQGSGFGNTYLAGAIYAAQSALISEQSANPGSKNALIILTDGGMNASEYAKNSSDYTSPNGTNQYADASEFPEAPAGSEVGPTFSGYPTPSYYTPAKILTSQKTLGYDTLSSTSTGSGQTRSSTTKGIYPDWFDQCQQSIVAAQYAQAHGTAVYAVAYGAGQSGCNSGWSIGLTDQTLVATGDNQAFTLAELTPCVEIENMASSLSNFYSDYAQSGSNSNCEDNAHTVTSLSGIFSAIAATFTNPRLLPNNAQ